MAKLLPPMPVGVPPDHSFWNDWYEKLRSLVNSISTSISWSIITGKPTTLAGYGITDGQTKLNNSAGLAAALSDETGTGLAVFNSTPTLVKPNITASSGETAKFANSNTGGYAGFYHSTSTLYGLLGNASDLMFGGTVGDYAIRGENAVVVGIGGTPYIRLTSTNTTFSNPIVTTGSVTVGSTSLLTSSVALSNGAAAAVGTLNNAPVAGNPTKWISINDNGTTRYIPAW